MSPLDAARLLTALLASPQANAAAEAVERYAQTRIDKTRSSDKLFGAAKISDLAALPAHHSFVEGLEALIASASTGSLAELIARAKDGWIPHIEIFAFTLATRGRIRVAGLPNSLTSSVEYRLVPHRAPSREARTAGNAVGDLEQSRRVTGSTILPIAELLREERVK
jgi:hypothetical protein